MIKSIQLLWLLFSVCMRLTQNQITRKAFIISDIFPDLLHFRVTVRANATFIWTVNVTIQSHADTR